MSGRQPAKRYTREDYNPFIRPGGTVQRAGDVLLPLPNATEVDPGWFLSSLSSVGHSWTPEWGYARLADDPHDTWTYFFLNDSGGGYAVVYGAGASVGHERRAQVVQFFICKHEKVEGAGADPRRGWHPGHCRLCGMDMTYDSGD